MYIAWAITGGGTWIREIVDVMKVLKKEYGVKITVLFSKWGYEVARIYGVLREISRIASGEYYEEIFIEDKGMYYIGRLNRRKYKVLVIAPATSNTIAKMVYGIADTLPTAAYAQALKSNIPVVILPTDIPNKDGYIVTRIPCYVDRSLCKYEVEKECMAMKHCPQHAILLYNEKPRILLEKCIGCGSCIQACKYNAIKCWEEIMIKPREIDLSNINKLKRISNTFVVSNIEELLDTIKKLLEVR